jgi:hypothetical protein
MVAVHDVAYIAAGYLATALSIGGYRWRLTIRGRRARRHLDAVAGRPSSGSR